MICGPAEAAECRFQMMKKRERTAAEVNDTTIALFVIKMVIFSHLTVTLSIIVWTIPENRKEE